MRERQTDTNTDANAGKGATVIMNIDKESASEVKK